MVWFYTLFFWTTFLVFYFLIVVSSTFIPSVFWILITLITLKGFEWQAGVNCFVYFQSSYTLSTAYGYPWELFLGIRECLDQFGGTRVDGASTKNLSEQPINRVDRRKGEIKNFIILNQNKRKWSLYLVAKFKKIQLTSEACRCNSRTL